MKMYHLGFCVLMGSWSVVYAMELQVEESQEIAPQEIAVRRARTLLELGKMLVERKEYEKAREYLEEAATQGADKVSAVVARVKLGELYYGGFGVEIDYEKAHECFMMAAHQKEDLQAQVVACEHLGEMYVLGRGVEKDYEKAGVYFQVLNNAEIKGAGFFVSSVALKHWRLIEPQLKRLYGITPDGVQVDKLREEIIAEYGKLEAKSLIELIHALYYADIPVLLEIACDEVKQSALGRFSFEQINSLPGDLGNRIILDKILAACGPMPARELAVGRGHDNLVFTVCVTNDGKIVSGSADKTIRVWDMQGNQLATCWGHEGSVYSVCVTAGGKIVSGAIDKAIRVWDMRGKELTICRGHEQAVYSVCITADGKIVSGSFDKTVRVWDLQGNQLAICKGHKSLYRSVCITSDGNIVSGSDDKTIRVWDMQGKELGYAGAMNVVLLSVCVTNDGKIVSGSYDQTIRVWDIGLLGRIVHMDQDQGTSDVGIITQYF